MKKVKGSKVPKQNDPQSEKQSNNNAPDAHPSKQNERPAARVPGAPSPQSSSSSSQAMPAQELPDAHPVDGTPAPNNAAPQSHIAAIGKELASVKDGTAPDIAAVFRQLEIDGKGKPKNTIGNFVAILENDPQLAGHIYLNTFKGVFAIRGGMPWNKTAYQWSDNDDANLRAYIEKNYQLRGKDNLSDAMFVVTNKHREHPIRKYLKSLNWDGVPRLDKLIIDYIGAENTELNRAFTRKWFVAAVARAMSDRPVKFDNCLTLSGKQHIGKSITFRVMANVGGNDFFQDSLDNFNGKEPMEQIQGYWIIELAEFSAVNSSSKEKAKNFLSKTSDDFRNTYGKNVESHRRQCVFCATTNEAYFLKGDENRRFWVIRVDPKYRKFPGADATALLRDREQLWAEAFYYYEQGESLELSDELYKQALEIQSEANVIADDPLTNDIMDFVKSRVPVDWESRDLAARREYWRNPSDDPSETKERTKVCAREYLSEKDCLEPTDKNYKYLSRRINSILRANLNWQETTANFGKIYGEKQRGFVKPSETNDLFKHEQ